MCIMDSEKKTGWDYVFSGRKRLSDEEAIAIKLIIAVFGKEV